MTLHGIVLFVHVLLGIGLVGGSVWADVAGARLRRARTVDAALAHAEVLRTFNRAAPPLAIGVFLAGAYLATVGSMWAEPWLIASLLSFLVVGAAAGTVVSPATETVVEALESAGEGPVPPHFSSLATAPGITTVTSLFAGIDLSLVFLMTNKPGLVGAVASVLVGLAVGMVLGGRHRSRATAVA